MNRLMNRDWLAGKIIKSNSNTNSFRNLKVKSKSSNKKQTINKTAKKSRGLLLVLPSTSSCSAIEYQTELYLTQQLFNQAVVCMAHVWAPLRQAGSYERFIDEIRETYINVCCPSNINYIFIIITSMI